MKREAFYRCRAGGFTLIELMVVVAIIAFVSAAVVPSFSLALARGRQREAGNLIVQAVAGARGRAARTGRCHRFTVNMSTPKVVGGFGGSVVLEEAYNLAPACTDADRCRAAACWRVLSTKAIAPNAGHVGLVGDDVSIPQVTARDGTVIQNGGSYSVRFEPSGGSLDLLQDLYFEVDSHKGNGVVRGVPRFVMVSAGGSTRLGGRP